MAEINLTKYAKFEMKLEIIKISLFFAYVFAQKICKNGRIKKLITVKGERFGSDSQMSNETKIVVVKKFKK